MTLILNKIGVASEGTKDPVFKLLKDRSDVITIPEAKKGSWIKVNPGQRGFYRGKFIVVDNISILFSYVLYIYIYILYNMLYNNFNFEKSSTRMRC